MNRINCLNEEIFMRIAAGEVIDGPYSVVKELIENSLDAGATEIEIRIEKAGKQLIEVTDNGNGIHKDDLRRAFYSHATSKISSVNDLDAIQTLGFRGEALASISSVAKCDLISATEGEMAFKVHSEGLVTDEPMPAVLQRGTRIVVRNLFYNTPVRAKFLRPDKKEEAEVTNYVTRYILGNPFVCFTYYVDGKLRLQSYGGGLDEAIAQVYGAATISQCFKINAQKNEITVHGFIGNQNYFKPNKSYQHVFLNGRNICNNCIATAINAAYSHYAMKRQYPFYVLFVDMPTDCVDVNVHPNKADVRFVDNQLVFGTIYKIITSILDGTSSAAEFVVSGLRLPEIRSMSQPNPNVVYGGASTLSANDFDQLYNNVKEVPQYVEGKKQPQAEAQPAAQPDIIDVLMQPEEPTQVKSNPYEDAEEPIQIRLKDSLLVEKPNFKPDLAVCTPSAKNGAIGMADINRERIEREQQRIVFQSCKYKGSLFNTYLIYEMENYAYLIDQHAAHERLLYDAYMEKLKNRQVVIQGMLYPFILTLNAQESQFLTENIKLVRDMGFTVSPFGVDTYRVTEVPADFINIDLQEFFDELLSDISGLRNIQLEDVLKDKIASAACKSAVKGGMELTQDEIDKLFALMKGDIGLKCPHGRPVCVRLTKSQIEKMFKRIV